MRSLAATRLHLLASPLPLAALACLSCGTSTSASVAMARPSELALLVLDAGEYDRMLSMRPEEALARYGETVDGYLCRDCEFTLSTPISRFREDLLTRFSREEVARGDIWIKEMTWKVDAFRNLTIWYCRGTSGLWPVHQMVWNRAWQFDVTPDG